MPAIIISRSNEYANRARNYHIYIDGKMVEKISNGEVKKIHVEQGTHKVRAAIDWCGSPEITVDLRENETADLDVAAFRYAGYIPIAIVSIILIRLVATRFVAHADYFFLLLLPIALIMAYFLSFGRNRYLRLSQQQRDLFF